MSLPNADWLREPDILYTIITHPRTHMALLPMLFDFVQYSYSYTSWYIVEYSLVYFDYTGSFDLYHVIYTISSIGSLEIRSTTAPYSVSASCIYK